MIRHCSLWNFDAELSPDELDDLARAFVEMARGIPAVRAAVAGRNVGPAPGNFSLAALIDFDAVEGYAEYGKNASHLAFYHDVLKPLGGQRAALQFELPPAPAAV
jgi:hypothetical protein